MIRGTILLGLVAATLGAPFDGRVVGGNDANITDYPYMASLRWLDKHFCGASILNERTLLTAAHCTAIFKNVNWHGHLTIRVGSSNIHNGDPYTVQAIYQHVEYNKQTKENDLSVIKVSKDIVYKPAVSPIQIVDAGKQIVPNTKAIVTGWGHERHKAKTFPETLQMAELNLVSQDTCQSDYPLKNISELMICTKTPNKDACQGDSGGPLVQNGRLIGVVSWGKGCADPKHAGVFVNVSQYNEWITPYLK